MSMRTLHGESRASWVPTWGPRDYIAIIRARRRLIGASALLGLFLSVIFITATGDEVEGPLPADEAQRASAYLRVYVPVSDAMPATDLTAEVARQILLSEDLARAVRSSLNLDATTTELVEDLQVEPLVESDVLVLSYARPDEDLAKDVVEVFANSFVEQRQEDLRRLQQDAREALLDSQRRLDRMLQQIERAGRRGDRATIATISGFVGPEVSRLHDLEDEVTELRRLREETRVLGPVLEEPPHGFVASAEGTEAEASPADPPPPPSPRRSPVVLLIAGLIVGLIAGTGLALGWELVDPHVRTVEAVTHRIDTPVLVELPEDAEDADDELRKLNVLMRASGSDPGTISVASVSDPALSTKLAKRLVEVSPTIRKQNAVTAKEFAAAGSQKAPPDDPQVVDAGAISNGSDALLACSLADGTILLVRLHTSVRDLDRALDDLQAVGGRLRGVVAVT